MTSGLRGSPALSTSRSGGFQALKSSWITIRQTVGGAHKLVTEQRVSVSSSRRAENRVALRISTHASAFHGAKTLLHACFAQPGDEMLRWTSPGCSASQYMVARWPIG